MNYKRFYISVICIFCFAIIWNGIVHMVILREADSILNTIGRPEAERNLWLSLLGTIVLSVLFVLSYARFAKQGNLKEGIIHGLFFGLLAGVLVDLNQYVLYPVPGLLAFKWFIFGLCEFCIYGIIVSKLYPLYGNKLHE